MKKIIVVFGLMLVLASRSFANVPLETRKEKVPNPDTNTAVVVGCVTVSATITNADGNSVNISITACHIDNYTALMTAIDIAARLVSQQ